MNMLERKKNVKLMKSKILNRCQNRSIKEFRSSYWERHSEYTPESRIETHESMQKKRERESNELIQREEIIVTR